MRKNEPIWIIFGPQNPEEILHNIHHTRKMLTLYLVKCRKYHFQVAAATALLSEHEIDLFLHQLKTVYTAAIYPVNSQNYLILIQTVEAVKKRDMCVNQLLRTHPIMHFQQLHNGLNSSTQFDWLVVKITWSVYQHKRWPLLTIAVMCLFEI